MNEYSHYTASLFCVNAIQNLTTDGTFELFTEDATIFEQGKVEGTYKEYIIHGCRYDFVPCEYY